MKAPSKTESAEATYIRTTPGSRALYHEACRVMPGGTTRTTVYFAPYPLYIERGQGARVWDVDGTSRLDFIGNYSALILGHAHPKVTAAVAEQLARGTSVAAANPVEVQLALQAKGVARELVADALAEILMDESNVDGAVAAGALRLPSLHGTPLAIRRKLGAYLARRGYEAEVIDEACGRLLGTTSADEADNQAAGAGPGRS